MGAADSIPGVSGGTMALIVGIYERLLASIGEGARALMSLVRFDPSGFVYRLRRVQWRLLVPLLMGIVTALGLAARFILDLMERRPHESLGLFLGLVAGSLVIPWSRIASRVPRTIGLGLAAAVIAFVLSGLPSGAIEEPAGWQVFFGAMVAICAMILPGVSGAFLLKVMGIYEPTLAAVRDLDGGYVALFVAGAVIGLGTFAVVLVRLLARRHDGTMAVLVGLMAGSLRALWPWQADDRSLRLPSGDQPVAAVVVAIVAGVVAVTVIERLGRRSASPTAKNSSSAGSGE